MDCCGLSSTGLQDIDANNITADNITIYSFLNVSGFSNLNELTVNGNVSLSSLNVSGNAIINNNVTLLSSLNVSGFTNLNNTTNINGSLYISGSNILQLLNTYGTNFSTLDTTISNVQNTLVTHGTSLSNLNALITLENDITKIHGLTPQSEIQFNIEDSTIECLSKVNKDGEMCVYHPYNILLPQQSAGYWVVHDEIEGLEKQALIDAAKFVAHDILIEGAGVTALKATEGVAAISLYLGINSIVDAMTGGGGDPPTPIDVTAININLSNVRNDLNSLSSSSTLAITGLNNTTTSILGYVNGTTRFSNLNAINLNVSGNSILNNATFISSLNVSGFTLLNDTTINGILNVSSSSIFNNNATFISSLNVSAFSILNSTSINGILNVSSNTILNSTSINSSLNVSGVSTFNSITLNKNYVNPTGNSLNFYYNTSCSSFTDNGYSSYFSLNSNITTASGLAVEPFIRVYNRMFKNGANTAMDLKTFGNSNSNVNSDVLIRLDSGGDPTPGANSGKISYNINGLDRHIMTATGLAINTTGPGLFALNVNGDTLLSNNTTIFGTLNISGYSKLVNDTTLISSLNVSGFAMLSNNTTIFGTLNISGYSKLVNDTTLISSLNVSGFTTLSNNTIFGSLNISGYSKLVNDTTLISSLNVSGFTTLSNNTTIFGTLNISGYSKLVNDTTLSATLNVSGFTTLSNNTTIFGTLNISGYSKLSNNVTLSSSLNVSGLATLSNNTTLLSSLNVSGRTVIGNNLYNYSDSTFEVNKNLIIRNYATNGSRIDMQVGLGYERSLISLEQGYDINLYTPTGGANIKSIALSTDQILLTAPNTFISGKINNSNGLNIGSKSPISFTTNRNININGTTFSCYDLDLNLYTKYISLDGYNIRQFRFRSWLADADFQMYNTQQTRYDVFMSNRNGLSVSAFAAPFDNPFLDETKYNEQFLYRYDFNKVIYCSKWGVKKVYCIIEDLL